MWALVTGVAIGPGLMQTARIPCGAPSAATCRVKPMTAALPAEWAAIGVTGDPNMPASEAMLMITPPPRATRWGQANWVATKTISISARIVYWKSSSDISGIGAKRVMAALL